MWVLCRPNRPLDMPFRLFNSIVRGFEIPGISTAIWCWVRLNYVFGESLKFKPLIVVIELDDMILLVREMRLRDLPCVKRLFRRSYEPRWRPDSWLTARSYDPRRTVRDLCYLHCPEWTTVDTLKNVNTANSFCYRTPLVLVVRCYVNRA